MKGEARLKRNKDLPDPIGHVTLKDDTQAPAHLTIPQPDGGTALIPTIEVAESSKELGSFFNPAEDGTHHQTEMKGKGLMWVDNILTRPLPTRTAWLSFFLTLMQCITWGLVVDNMAPKTLDKMTQALYFKILPFLGVNRHISKE